MKLIKVQVSSRGVYSYIHRVDESDPATQTVYTQEQVDEMPEVDVHSFEGSYLDLEKNHWKQKRREEYETKTPYEQIEMMADGTFDAWYNSIKEKYPKNA